MPATAITPRPSEAKFVASAEGRCGLCASNRSGWALPWECPECEREETVVVKHDRNRADAHAVASVPGRSVSWFPCRDGGPVGFPRRLGRPTPSWN